MKVHTYTGGTATILTSYTNVGSTALRGKHIVSVKKDGIGYSKIKTAGLPTAKEAVYFTLSGNILVDGKVEPGEIVKTLFQDL